MEALVAMASTSTIGTRLSAALRGVVVAFEIDEIDCSHHRGWSVLAVGEAQVVGDDEADVLRARLALAPWAPGEGDHLVRIQPTFLSGRRIGCGSSA